MPVPGKPVTIADVIAALRCIPDKVVATPASAGDGSTNVHTLAVPDRVPTITLVDVAKQLGCSSPNDGRGGCETLKGRIRIHSNLPGGALPRWELESNGRNPHYEVTPEIQRLLDEEVGTTTNQSVKSSETPSRNSQVATSTKSKKWLWCP